ncbi:hypothetical protein P7C70_g3666, partial [Phenoliferia sp. Uapishka_3]
MLNAIGLAQPTLHLSLTEELLYLHPAPEGTPTEDPWVSGNVTLWLPKARNLRHLTVRLLGKMEIAWPDNRPYESAIVLDKLVTLFEEDKDVLLSKGEHTFAFSIIVPSSTATYERCAFGRVRHSVTAKAKGLGAMGGDVISNEKTLFLIVNPGGAGASSPPPPLHHKIEGIVDEVGPYTIALQSQNIMIGGLLLLRFNIVSPPTDLEIYSLKVKINQHFHLRSSSDPAHKLSPPVDPRTVLIIDSAHPANFGKVDGPADAAARSISRAPTLGPLTVVPRGEGFKVHHLARLPNDNLLRPTTQPGTETGIAVSHTIAVEVTYRVVLDEASEANESKFSKGKESVRDRRKLVVSRPLDIFSTGKSGASCCRTLREVQGEIRMRGSGGYGESSVESRMGREPSHQSHFVSLPPMDRRSSAATKHVARKSFFHRSGRLAKYIPPSLRKPKALLVMLNIAVLVYLVLRPTPSSPLPAAITVSPPTLPSLNTTIIPNHVTYVSDPNTDTCETCILRPNDPLCEYGIDNIRLSRNYEGSGYRIRKMLERAIRGEEITIAVIGASVTAGHGIEGQTKWQDRFMEDFSKVFPKTKMTVGAAPGMNSKWFSFCFDALVTTTADLYIVELDINNDAAEYTYHDDDALYRGLLNLPQKPAVLRASVFALIFDDLSRGAPSSFLMSQWFDIPVIGIRNWILPHLIEHPVEAELFFARTYGELDKRHISELGHRALGDMLALYMRSQTCEARRRRANPPPIRQNAWPQGDILGLVPKQYIWTKFDPTEQITPLFPSCSLVGSKLRPLRPAPSTKGWDHIEWNGKKAIASTTVGSTISFPFTGTKIGIFVWSSNGLKWDVGPGRCICSVDNDEGTVVDAWIPSEFAHSEFNMVKEGLDPGYHTLTCTIIPESSSPGHNFRILGIGSQ